MSSVVNSVTQAVQHLSNAASDTANSIAEQASAAVSKGAAKVKEPFQRLPGNVKPSHYDLKLVPDLSKFTFDGEVIIQLSVVEATRRIVLNAAELTLKEASLTRGSQVLTDIKITSNEEAETATLELSEEIAAGGDVLLKIVYTGILNDKLNGFYRSKYKGEDGSDRYLAATQFESTDARRALPCWDEPALKATFSVVIQAPAGLTVVSNMPPISTVQAGEKKNYDVWTFDRTPIMSTYLLAFVVGEFDYLEDKTSNGTVLRVYTMKGKKTQGQFALDTGKRALEFYNEYFKIPYPLPKMDQLAIPDFSAGAMENW